MPSKFKLTQETDNTFEPIRSESQLLTNLENHADARLGNKVHVGHNKQDRLELHIYFPNQAATPASKIYVKFRTSIVETADEDTMADWAYIQIDKLNPTTGEAEVLDLKYTIDISDDNIKRYVLNVPAVGTWMSAVVWADQATGANNAVTFSWMRSS